MTESTELSVRRHTHTCADSKARKRERDRKKEEESTGHSLMNEYIVSTIIKKRAKLSSAVCTKIRSEGFWNRFLRIACFIDLNLRFWVDADKLVYKTSAQIYLHIITIMSISC